MTLTFFGFFKKVKFMTWLLGDLTWHFLKKMTFGASLHETLCFSSHRELFCATSYVWKHIEIEREREVWEREGSDLLYVKLLSFKGEKLQFAFYFLFLFFFIWLMSSLGRVYFIFIIIKINISNDCVLLYDLCHNDYRIYWIISDSNYKRILKMIKIDYKRIRL